MPRPVQTLLLDPTYWKTRLKGVQDGSGNWLSSPREDLSDNCRSVEEFRLKAHDGQILWGLISYPTFFNGARPCSIRATGPADPIKLDPVAAEKGMIEILVQSPAGRRLEDRVLDLIRIYHQAGRQARVQSQALEILTDTESMSEQEANSKSTTPRAEHPTTPRSDSWRIPRSKHVLDPLNPESALCGKRRRPPADEVWIAREILRRLP